MLIALTSALLCVASTRAQAPDVYLSWQRPVGGQCPTRDALVADVEALMERAVFVARDEARVLLRGVAVEDPVGVRVTIDALDERGDVIGTRELTAGPLDCASLRSAIALVLTMFIEHELAARSASAISLGVGAEASLAQAPLPRLSLSVGPALEVRIGPLAQLRAVASYWLPVAIETPRGVGATVEAASLELGGCAHIWAGLGLCAGFEGGVLIASPRQLNGPARHNRLLAHAILEGMYELDLEAIRFSAAAGAQLSLSRPELSYLTGEGERRAVYRPQELGINLRLSIIIPAE